MTENKLTSKKRRDIFEREPYKTKIKMMRARNYTLSSFSNEDLIHMYKEGVLDTRHEIIDRIINKNMKSIKLNKILGEKHEQY